MSERRPHWDDALVYAVIHEIGVLRPSPHSLRDTAYAVIAAVEDWHEMHGTFRVLADRAASAEADRDRLANQLLNEVPDSYIQMKARALDAEAAIRRVREVCERDSFWINHAKTGGWGKALTVAQVLAALKGERDE